MNDVNDDQRLSVPGVPDADTVRAIEAIVMVAVEPVPTDLLAQLLEVPTHVIDDLCRELASSYDEAGHGFELVKVAGGYRYQTRGDLAPYVERFLLDGQRARVFEHVTVLDETLAQHQRQQRPFLPICTDQ